MNLHLRVIVGTGALALLAASVPAFGQGPGDRPPIDREHHAGGKVTSVAGDVLTVTNREGMSRDIVVSAGTTIEVRRNPATVADIHVNDFLVATGDVDDNGRFVAEHIAVGNRPPRMPGPPPPPDGIHAVAGVIVSVDPASRSLTLEGRDGETEVVTVSATAEISRDRKPATLADFMAGDHVFLGGGRDDDGTFIAEHVGGGSEPPPMHRHHPKEH